MNQHYNNQNLIIDVKAEIDGSVAWQSPSNIALVKYWGKRKGQLPCNPSISFTLSEANTLTKIHYQSRVDSRPWIKFLFEGKEEQSFAKRIEGFLSSIMDVFPFLSQMNLIIDSSNTFPHSSGIASSASSMSSLALGLCSIEKTLFGTLSQAKDFYQKASYIARIGSGSACRSLYPHIAAWGVSDQLSESSDLFATPFQTAHDIFTSFHDDVIIVSAEKKSVSSTVGHSLMDTNPFANTRYTQAHKNLNNLIPILETGDLDAFGKIVEDEALTLHALMMCSHPSYILMKPNTLECLDRIRLFRREQKVPVYFTLDAGPNVHVLYPNAYKMQVSEFIEQQLKPLAEEGLIIKDQVGLGPKEVIVR